jgi:hypothetical protein
MPSQLSQHADEPVITPVRITPDERQSGRLEVVEEAEGRRRTLAWGFGSREAAERWVAGHNQLSRWHELRLIEA